MRHWSVLELALRVLVAVTDGIDPAPDDLACLWEFAPELFGEPVDEMACEIVSRLKVPGTAAA
jgi:hypothetical protein